MKNKKRYSFGKRIKYRLDEFVSKGFLAQTGLLAGITLILALLFGFVAWKLGEPNYTEGYWTSLMHMIDQGTITGDEKGTGSYYLFMLFVTFVGMAITGTTIAIVNTAIQTGLDELKKGHSAVIERRHTVILGFDENACTVCREIVEGGRADGRRVCVVIADNLPKEEMEHSAREYRGGMVQYFEKYARSEKKQQKPNILFRSGDPVSENTFAICNVQEANAVIINREDDLETIRILLSLSSYLKKHKAYIEDSRMPSVVAVIRNRENVTAAKAAAGLSCSSKAGRKERNEYRVRILYSREIQGQLFAQACIQPGLPFVLDGLFNFIGSSIRLEEKKKDEKAKDRFLGKPVSGICTADAIPLGFFCMEAPDRARVCLCPPEERTYQKGDSLICLSEDPEICQTEDKPPKPVGQPAAAGNLPASGRWNLLLIGRNGALPELLRRLGENADRGHIRMILPEEPEETEARGGIPSANIYRCEDPCRWSFVKRIMETEKDWFEPDSPERLTHIVLLSEERAEKTRADEKLMTLLLNLRSYLKEHSCGDISLISEVNLPKNQLLLQNESGNDFVVAFEIINRMAAQIAGDPRKYYVMEDLLKRRGGRIELHPLKDYTDTSVEFNFEGVFRMAEAAAEKREKRLIPLGWFRMEPEGGPGQTDPDSRLSLVLNPPRKDLEEVHKAGDYWNYRLIVLVGDRK